MEVGKNPSLGDVIDSLREELQYTGKVLVEMKDFVNFREPPASPQNEKTNEGPPTHKELLLFLIKMVESQRNLLSGILGAMQSEIGPTYPLLR